MTVAARSKTPGWSVALPEKLEPTYLLALEDRVVVVGAPDRVGRQPVAIFDSTGAMQAQLRGRAGAWAIDARADVLLGTMDDGMPAAWSLRDGNLRATMLIQLGGRGLDTLVVCDGTMLVGTRELPQRDRLLPNVTLEVVHIASYDSVTESDILEDAESAAAVIREHHDRLLAAAGPSGPVLALEAGGLAWTDWLLQPHAELRADVLPLGLSAHHDGSARAVVRTPEQIEFWQAQPGERRFTVPIGDPFADAATPAIHDDGMTVLASSSRIAAYWASGRVAWAFSREGPPGALIDAAGNTIVSHRELLLAYDRSGKATPLWTAPAPIVTAPIVARDRLYVCTSTNIFSLPA